MKVKEEMNVYESPQVQIIEIKVESGFTRVQLEDFDGEGY